MGIPVSVVSGTLLAAAVIGYLCTAALWDAHHLDLYTADRDIRRVANTNTLGVVLSVPPYAVMMFLLGVMRGADLQGWGAAAVAVSFFICGLPVGAWLGLHAGWGLLGVWMMNVTGLTCSALSIALRLSCVDWKRIVNAAVRSQDPLGVALLATIGPRTLCT